MWVLVRKINSTEWVICINNVWINNYLYWRFALFLLPLFSAGPSWQMLSLFYLLVQPSTSTFTSFCLLFRKGGWLRGAAWGRGRLLHNLRITSWTGRHDPPRATCPRVRTNNVLWCHGHRPSGPTDSGICTHTQPAVSIWNLYDKIKLKCRYRKTKYHSK